MRWYINKQTGDLTIYFSVSKHKGVEINLCRQEQWQWFELSLRVDRAVDHAGLHLNFEVLGFNFQFDLYDGRHWNYERDRWYLPGEEGEHEVDRRDE